MQVISLRPRQAAGVVDGPGRRSLQNRTDMQFTVETEQETDGRWIAEVTELPGVLAYGTTREQAASMAQALALRVLADRIEHGEWAPDLADVTFTAV